jgi:hypothetical protein
VPLHAPNTRTVKRGIDVDLCRAVRGARRCVQHLARFRAVVVLGLDEENGCLRALYRSDQNTAQRGGQIPGDRRSGQIDGRTIRVPFSPERRLDPSERVSHDRDALRLDERLGLKPPDGNATVSAAVPA